MKNFMYFKNFLFTFNKSIKIRQLNFFYQIYIQISFHNFKKHLSLRKFNTIIVNLSKYDTNRKRKLNKVYIF